MTQLQLTGQETLLAIAILAFVVIGIIVLFKTYFRKLSETNLSDYHNEDDEIKTLNSRVKYTEVNAFAWTRPIFLIGLAASVSFTLLAFSWTTEQKQEVYAMELGPVELDDIEIARTQHPSPKPPPPPPPPIIEIPVEIIPEDLQETFIDQTIDPSEAIEEPTVDTGEAEGTGEPGPPLPPVVPVYTQDEDIDEIHVVAEQMPRFPGCEDIGGTKREKQKCAEKKLLDYIYDNLKYPNLAVENSIEGRSTLRFIVDTEGNITDVKILQDPGAGCGKAAAKVIESMNNMPTKWTPGMQRGRPVKVQYTLPIQFKLK